MANPPPPYDDITGISRTVMKDNAQESIGNYNGNARPGEIVVDLTTNPPTPYIGNNIGQLTLLTSAGTYGNIQVGQYLEAGQVGNIIPSGNAVYTLGNATNQWSDLYVSNATIYMNNVPISLTADNVLTVDGNDIITQSANGLQANIGEFVFNSNALQNTNGGSFDNGSPVNGWTSKLQLPDNGNTSSVGLYNTYGNITLSAGANAYSTAFWTFDNTGNLVLPSNSAAINYANGSPYGGSGGGANIGNLDITGTYVSIAAGADETLITISPNIEGQAYLQIPNDATANTADVRLHNDAGNIELGTGSGSYNWYFDNAGNVTIPGAITSSITIALDNRATSNSADIQLYSADDILVQGRDKPDDLEAEGGDINIYAGQGSNSVTESNDTGGGGDIQIRGGLGGSDVGGGFGGSSGGFVSISGGNGGTGDVTTNAGSGGSLSLSAGSAAGTANTALGGVGGSISITAGDTTRINEIGGTISLNTGAASGDGTGAAGYVEINIPSSNVGPGGTWTFGGTGTTLNVPGNAEIYGANFGNFTVGCAGNTIVTSSEYGSGNVKNWVFGSTGELTAPGSATFGTGNTGVQLQSNTDGYGLDASIGNITNGNPTVVVTLTDVEFPGPVSGTVRITGVEGETEANGFWGWEAVDVDQIQLYTDGTLTTPVDGTAWNAYTGGGTVIASGYNNLDIVGGTVAIQSGAGKYWSFNPDGTFVPPTLRVDLHNGGNQNAQTLQFGGDQQAVITGPTPTGGSNAQRLIIQGQNGGTGEGGDVYLWAGDAQTNGGDIKIYAGDADDVTTGYGGYVNIDGGAGFTAGGVVDITGGSSGNAQGAFVRLTGGLGQTSGGDAIILGGQGSTENGGNVTLTAGYGANVGGNVNITGGISGLGLPGYGNVNINAGASTWAFDNTGNLNLASDGKLVGVTANNDGHINWVGNSSGDGYGYTTMNLVPDDTVNDSYLILDPTAPNHIHIRAGGTQDNSSSQLYLGGENSYFKVDNGLNPNVYVTANSKVWTFGTDSNITLPSGTPAIQTPDQTGTITLKVRGGVTEQSLLELGSDGGNDQFVYISTQDNSGNRATFDMGAYAGTPAYAQIQTYDGVSVTQNWLFTTAPLDPTEAYLYVPGGASITTPNATGGAGGKNIFIEAGAADQSTYSTSAGGELMLKGGRGAFNDGGGGGPGGNVNINAGESADPAGHAGNVYITAGALQSWVFDYTGVLTAPKSVIITPVAYSSLTATAGARAFVNNANLVAAGNFGSQISGGGANTVPVWSDGTNWYIG